MKRTNKNIISVVAIIILIASMCLTIYLAKINNTSSNNSQVTENNGMGTPPGSDSTSSNTPPSMPGSGNSSDSSQTPPEKPDGDTSTNGDTQTPPTKPDGDTSANDSQTPPEKPSGESDSTDSSNQPSMPSNGSTDNSTSNGMQTPQDMNQSNTESTSTKSLTVIYYVAFGIESLLLSMIVVYLILSKFNKYGIKESYSSSDKVVIYILINIIATGCLTYGLSYVTNNYVLSNSSNTSNSSNGNMNNNSNSNSNISYSSSNEITTSQDISNKEYSSSNSDENALSISGDVDVNISDISVTKTGDSDGGDNTSFYGTNSAIIAKDGANVTIDNVEVTTNASGANGIFSYGGSATTSNATGDGTTVNITNSKVTTTKDNSGGIMTTGGGITNVEDCEVTTAGTSSAAIRTDRGGGTVTVTGGTYKTTGQGSPSIYSTANVSVKDAYLVATASEGIVIEGKNSVSIDNTTLVDTNNKLNGQSTSYKNIFLYQSMSGDADTGVSSFSATNSKITTNKGDTFYITNTTAKITLENNTITNNDSDGNFLRAKADSWGTSGSNGGLVTLVMKNQTVKGNIVIDSVSTLDMTLSDSSSYTGTINGDNSAKSIKLTLDKSSKIKLTGDSYVTSLDNADSSNSNIDFNGYKLYVNGVAIN